MRASEIRKGTAVIIDGKLFVVTGADHNTPGNLRAKVQFKLRDVAKGTIQDKRVGATDDIETTTLDSRQVEYLYSDNEGHVLMDMETYEQDTIPSWHAPVKDERTGRWIDSHVMNQDFIAWVGQGAIADRTLEHLGESDRGVILIRKRLLEDIEAVAAGRDPKGIIRDPEANHSVHLPIIGGLDRRPAATDGPRPFVFLAGQPEEVTREFKRAWEDCAAAAASEALASGG